MASKQMLRFKTKDIKWQDLACLYSHTPVGATVQEWVLERLQAEIFPDKLARLSSKQSPSAKGVFELQAELVEINARVSALESGRKKRQSSI